MKSTIQFRVRYQESDQMGFVHHSVYLVWFEAGRTEWMRERGISYRTCEENGWLLPVIESGCRHLSPARYDDLISVETVFVPEKSASFQFEYIVKEASSGKILTQGFTRHVCIGRDHKITKEATRQLKKIFNS